MNDAAPTLPATTLPATDLHGVARRDDTTGPFFDALATGALLLHRCARCGHWARPDATTCSACHGGDLGWEPVSGRGAVVSRIVDHSRVREGVPIPLGLVELDEGPWLHVRLLGDPDVGGRVTLVVLRPVDDGEPIPAFTAV